MISTKRLLAFAASALTALALAPSLALGAVLSNPVYSVSFHNASSGFIAGTSGASGFVSATSDGGATWHATITPRLLFRIAASTDSASAMAAGDADGAVSTADSGATWTAEQPLLSRDVFDVRGVAYLAGGRRVAVGKLNSPGEYAYIASAVGAGAWLVDYEGPVYVAPDESTIATVTHADMAGVDAAPGGSVAWAVGNNRSGTVLEPLIFKTANGGSSWTTQTAPAGYDVSSVSAVDANNAFIGCATSKRILHTTDGSTWSVLSGTPTTITINAIDALDANTVVIVGDAGRIAWTTNALAGTPTWSVNTTATTNALLGVQVIDATHWVVVGNNETILRTSNGGASWTGSTAAAAPSAAITGPDVAHMLDSATVHAQGTASDGAGVGVARVDVRLQRLDGQYWNGSGWSPGESWLPANTHTDGSWDLDLSLPSTESAGGGVMLSARAVDGLGLVGAVVNRGSQPSTAITPNAASVIAAYNSYVSIGGTLKCGATLLSGKTVQLLSSGGAVLGSTTTGADGTFSFSVKPASTTTYRFAFAGDSGYGASSAVVGVAPKAYVGRPVVPSRVYRSKYFKTYCDLKPRHTSGSRPITFVFERWQRKSNGTYGWVKYKTVSGKAYNYSSYSRASANVKLSSRGSYRVWASHSDSAHALSTSSSRSFKVR